MSDTVATSIDPCIHVIPATDDPSPLLTWLNETWTPSKYNSVYTSFGSKLNSKEQFFNYPQEIRCKPYRSNAEYQLIPQFMREFIQPPEFGSFEKPQEKRNLIIVIDQFNEEALAINHRLLRRILSQASVPMDVVIFNHAVTPKTTKKLVKGLAKQFTEQSIPSDKCMFCNYIRFSHPNALEYELEECVPKVIQKVLDRPQFLHYSRCFYQWYGATVYAYNLVYNYKKYDTCWMMYSGHLMRLFQSAITGQPDHISEHNIHTITSYIETRTTSGEYINSSKMIWNLFSTHTVDLCTPRENGTPHWSQYPLVVKMGSP